jgi:hypothetical protein
MSAVAEQGRADRLQRNFNREGIDNAAVTEVLDEPGIEDEGESWTCSRDVCDGVG